MVWMLCLIGQQCMRHLQLHWKSSCYCVKYPLYMHQVEEWLKTCKLGDLTRDDFFEIKRKGFSDAQLARFLGRRPAIFRQETD